MNKCIYCNYETDIVSNFNKHLKTKKHLINKENKTLKNTDTFSPSQILTNPSQILTNPSQILTNPHKSSQSLTNPSQILTNPSLILTNTSQIPHKSSQKVLVNSVENLNNYECEYCKKVFSRSDNLNRHINKYCKVKKKIINDKNILVDIKNDEKDKIMEEQKQRIDQIEREKTMMQKQIELLLDKVGDTTNITTNQHIVLNCYGNEDLTHISNNFKMELLKIPYAMIPKLIKEVHFNQNYPQNNNIYLPNKKEPYVKIYQDQTWVYKDKKETIKELVEKNYSILDDYYEGNRESLDSEENKRFISFQEKKTSKDIDKKISKNVEMVLLDGSR